MNPTVLPLRAQIYRQFDANHDALVPEASYAGWEDITFDFDAHRIGVVVMHAWDVGTREQFPGWWNCCGEIPRTYKVCETLMPPLLKAIRATSLPLFHVVGGGEYFKETPGYKKAAALAGSDEPAAEQVIKDGRYFATRRFTSDRSFPGAHNLEDIKKGSPALNFASQTRPLDHELVVKDGRQLLAVCKAAGVNHLIYTGFNIDWCLLMSPGGMIDMWKHGVICSAIREAVTAVESKESAPTLMAKKIGLWRVSVQGGFIFKAADFVQDISPLATGHKPLPIEEVRAAVKALGQ